MPAPTPAYPELERTLRALEGASLEVLDARAEVSARLAHALWTPLSHVCEASARLLASNLPPEQREQAALAAAAAQMISGLLGEHLDLAHDRTEIAVDRTVFDLQQALAPVLKAFAPRAALTGVALACRFAPDIPPVLVGDAGRLRRAVLLLLEEALRSGPSERLTFEVSLLQTDRHDAHLGFAVDGMRDEPDSARGLCLLSRLAKEIDGRLALGSHEWAPGKVAFSARIGRIPERRHLRRTEGRRGGTQCLLLVDANEIERDALAEDLRARGFEVVCAGSLEAARSLCGDGTQFRAAGVSCEAWNAGAEHRLALCEALRPAPLFLLAPAVGRVADEGERALGVRGVLVRPVLPREFLVAVYFEPTGPRALHETGIAPRQPAAVQRLDALLAMAPSANRQLASSLLERAGHRVTAVPDGLTAMAKLAEQPFDVALLDLDLAMLDGPSVARLIRAREAREGGRVRIVSLHGGGVEALSARLTESGIDASLELPLDARTLAWTLARLCGDGSAGPEVGAA